MQWLEHIRPIWSLAAFSIATGLLALLVFRAVSKPARIRAAKSAVIAQLLEMRLYNDEPAVVWRAQRGLLIANLRYVTHLLIPSLVIAAPFLLIYPFLDDLWGRRAIAPGSDVVVTAEMRDAAAPNLVSMNDVVRVTSPAVRIVATREVSWRVRAMRSGIGNLVVDTATFPVYVGNEPQSVRTSVALGGPAGAVGSIRIPYPSSGLAVLGIRLPWEAWFLIISGACALLLRRRFGVQF